MKKVLLTALSLFASASMMAQGWILFQNTSTTGVLMPGGASPTSADAVYVELWGGLAGQQLQLLTGTNPTHPTAVPITRYDTANPSNKIPISSKGFAGGSWQVNGIPANVSAQFQIVAYSTLLNLRGTSAVVTGMLTEPPATPAALASMLPGLGVTQLQVIPEPSIMALGVLGIGALLLRRRLS